VYNIRAVAVYGGGGKYEMSRALKEQSPEMVIATPGRFIEMVRAVVLSCGVVALCSARKALCNDPLQLPVVTDS
jgi:superfamily II DNA/RNA helicase